MHEHLDSDPAKSIKKLLSRYEDTMIPELKGYFMQVLSGKTIKKIEIKNKKLGTKGDEILVYLLSKLPNLKELVLINNYISGEDAENITIGFDVLTNLETLTIADNKLGITGLFAITDSVLSYGCLKNVNLEGNQFLSSIVNELAEFLSKLENLEILNVRNNKLKSKGFKKIAKTLRNSESLREFYFDEVREEDLEEIQRYLPNTTLNPN